VNQRVLTILLGVILAALCGVCLWQWKREAEFRSVILDFHTKLEAEKRAHSEARLRIVVLESEVTRVTKLRDDAEAQYLKTLEELRALQPDWNQRGLTIGALSQLAAAAPAAENQNAAIGKQNELLKQLAAERDDAIQKLNARTREFNTLTEKYNKLVR
jgi:hypothetical protein